MKTCPKPSEHTDKIILKVFTCCSQTIYCSQFLVFVLIDACYHWKSLTEPLQPLPQLPSPGPTAEHCASQRLAPQAPTHCFSEATRGTEWHCRSHSQAGARDTPFTHVHTYPHPSIYVHTPLEVHCCDTVGQQLVVRNTYWFRALKPTHPLF